MYLVFFFELRDQIILEARPVDVSISSSALPHQQRSHKGKSYKRNPRGRQFLYRRCPIGQY